VASLGLVSPGAATDGVTPRGAYFFLEKLTTFFCLSLYHSCHFLCFHSGVTLLDGVTRAVYPLPPVTPLRLNVSNEKLLPCGSDGRLFHTWAHRLSHGALTLFTSKGDDLFSQRPRQVKEWSTVLVIISHHITRTFSAFPCDRWSSVLANSIAKNT